MPNELSTKLISAAKYSVDLSGGKPGVSKMESTQMAQANKLFKANFLRRIVYGELFRRFLAIRPAG